MRVIVRDGDSYKIARARQNAMAGTLSNTGADLESEIPEAGLTCFLNLYTAKDRIAITIAVPPVARNASESGITDNDYEDSLDCSILRTACSKL